MLKEKGESSMEETDQPTVIKGIELFKQRYGIHTPLDLFRFDEILEELKQEQIAKGKKKSRKKG